MLFITILQPQIHYIVKYACVLLSNSVIKFIKKIQHNNDFSNLNIPFLATVSLKRVFTQAVGSHKDVSTPTTCALWCAPVQQVLMHC